MRKLLAPLPLGPLRGTGGKISASFDRLPIRLRLAGVSALLTFVILCAFAVAIGSLTVHRIRSDFNRQVADNASELAREVTIKLNPAEPTRSLVDRPPLADFANTGNHAVIRIFTRFGEGLIAESPKGGPPLGHLGRRSGLCTAIASRSPPQRRARSPVATALIGEALLQYGRRVSDTEATVKRVELFLLIGVLAGSGFALLAGMAIARRAMAPIAELTSTAAEIARTRDPSKGVPQPLADDEVAVLARTLRGCSKSSTPRVERQRRCLPASAASWPTHRTSCALL